MRKFDNAGVAAYFDNNRIRLIISAVLYLLCCAIPFLPTVTGAAQQSLSSGEVDVINEAGLSLNFLYSGIGMSFFPVIVTVYAIAGAVLLVLGLIKRPSFIATVIMGVSAALFFVINMLAGAFIFVAVSSADINEVCTLSVWGWVSVGALVANMVNIFVFLPFLKKSKQEERAS